MLSIADDEHSGTTESHRLPRPLDGFMAFLTLALFSLLLAFPGTLYLLCYTDCHFLTSSRRDFGNGRSACQCNVPSTSERTRRVGNKHSNARTLP